MQTSLYPSTLCQELGIPLLKTSFYKGSVGPQDLQPHCECELGYFHSFIHSIVQKVKRHSVKQLEKVLECS